MTYAMLTLEGRDALKEHWKRLEDIRKGARALRPLKVLRNAGDSRSKLDHRDAMSIEFIARTRGS